MPDLEKLMWEDNERGLLAGTDRDGRPLIPLAASTMANRRSAVGVASPHNPPLIPAGIRSRAIANYRVTSIRGDRGSWLMVGAWKNVVSRRGVPFLGFHFVGAGRLPVRNIDGVRPDGRDKIGRALREWIRSRWF
jgi:hypothetical protein